MTQRKGIRGEVTVRFTQAEISKKFRQLAADLPGLEPHRQAQRIAILWDEIGCRNKILATVGSGINDIWLPMSMACQPLSLGPGEFMRLQDKQQLLLSNTFPITDSSRWPGDHANLCSAAVGWQKVPNSTEAQRTLGDGGFGEVLEVKCANNQVYALKRIRRKTELRDAQEQMNYVKMELDVLRRIKHCHYIRLVGSYTEPNHIGMLMHPVADGNLEQFLDEFVTGPSDEALLAGFFGCLATALMHLHFTWNIRHKDIKPRNVLVLRGQKNILLTDFGMSLDWSETGITTTNQEQLRSPVYCAPEVAKDKERNSMSDIWSLGCVFLEMAAVLKGRPRRFVRDTLTSCGSPKYWNCLKGIEKIIDDLLGGGSRWGNEPLLWTRQMLQKKKEDRPNSRQLRHMILQASGYRGAPFCGCCCTTDISLGKDADDEGHDEMAVSTTVGRSQVDGSSSSLPTVAATSPTIALLKTSGARVYDPLASAWGGVQLLRCPQSLNNWISAETVAKFNLEAQDVGETRTFALDAHLLEACQSVAVTWIEDGATKTHRNDFLVTQAGVTVPFDILGGSSLPR